MKSRSRRARRNWVLAARHRLVSSTTAPAFTTPNRPQRTWLRSRGCLKPLGDRNVVPDIPDRRDHGAPELCSKPADIDVHDIGAGVERVAPDLFEQIGATEHLA